MKVLVACEYSGIVRDAFSERGHDAWSCDILPTESKGNHIQDDVLNHLDKDWDLLIAHPPCTYLSRAGARWLYPKAGQLELVRYEKGLKGKEFFMQLLNAPTYKIAIENPTPFKIFKFVIKPLYPFSLLAPLFCHRFCNTCKSSTCIFCIMHEAST